jgi:RNA polymerase sigma-70 factor (ECF subfamily)
VNSRVSELAAGPTPEQIIAQDSSNSPESDLMVSELFIMESSESVFIESRNLDSEAPLSVFDTEPMDIVHPTAPFEDDLSAIPPVDLDRKVVEAFLAGSEEAFIQLYSKYEIPVLVYCKRMLHNDTIAEDAFQEVWTRIFELRLRKNIVIGHFRGLLFRSARNLCFNLLRTEKTHSGETEGLDENEELIIDESNTREASQREIQALLLRALGKLPFEQREAFVLHEYSGLSFAEIADIMRTTEMNIKVRAYRARLRLRKFIQGWLGLGETDDPVSYI